MNHQYKIGRGQLGLASAGAIAILLGAVPLHAELPFTGVAAGDASTTEAIVWTRAVDAAAPAGTLLTAQVSTDPGFGTIVASSSGTPTATTDYTIKFEVGGLTPGIRYYYRFVGPASEESIVGTFKTA